MHTHRVFKIGLRLSLERPDLDHAGVIDEDVDATKSRSHIGDHFFDRALIANIANGVEDFRSTCFQIFLCPLQLIAIYIVEKGQLLVQPVT